MGFGRSRLEAGRARPGLARIPLNDVPRLRSLKCKVRFASAQLTYLTTRDLDPKARLDRRPRDEGTPRVLSWGEGRAFVARWRAPARPPPGVDEEMRNDNASRPPSVLP